MAIRWAVLCRRISSPSADDSRIGFMVISFSPRLPSSMERSTNVSPTTAAMVCFRCLLESSSATASATVAVSASFIFSPSANDIVISAIYLNRLKNQFTCRSIESSPLSRYLLPHMQIGSARHKPLWYRVNHSEAYIQIGYYSIKKSGRRGRFRTADFFRVREALSR